MIKKVLLFFSLILGLSIGAVPTFAHAVVKPSQVGVAVYQNFTLEVPNEKDTPTTSIRILIPEGVQAVFPYVKPGWTIDTKKSGSGDGAQVTEIDWTGGSIPVGQRDSFSFNAQVPSTETSLNWKAYQVYQNGTTISWDQDPSTTQNMSDDDREKMEKAGKGPFSQTKVVNDLKNPSQTGNTMVKSGSSISSNTLAIAALGLAAFSLILQFRKR